jgi:hypothetical protein
MSTIVLDTDLDFDTPKVEKLFAVVTKVLTARHATGDKRSGASLYLATSDGEELYKTRKGTAPEEKFRSYDENAFDKVQTLIEHPEHQLSFQSHNMETGPYPGGARFLKLLLLAISGFTWQEDEIGVLWIGLKMGWIELKEVTALIRISQDNLHLFAELFNEFDRTEKVLLAA